MWIRGFGGVGLPQALGAGDSPTFAGLAMNTGGGGGYVTLDSTTTGAWGLKLRGAANSDAGGFFGNGSTGEIRIGGVGLNYFPTFYANGSERARITTGGGFVLQSGGALATAATDGFCYLPTCPGTPTGVPTAVPGAAAAVYDTTGNKLWVYNGAWKSVSLA